MNPYDGPHELPQHIMQMVEDGAPDFLFMDADDRFEAWANRPVKQATFIDHNIEKQSKISAMQRVAQVAQAKPAGSKTGIKSVKTDRRGQCWNSRTGRWESLIQPLHGSVAIMAKLLILPLDQDMKVIARGKTSLAPGATVNEIADKVGYAAGRCGKKVAFVWVTTEDQPDRPSLAEWHLVNDRLICVSPPSVQMPPASGEVPEIPNEVPNDEEETIVASKSKKASKAKAKVVKAKTAKAKNSNGTGTRGAKTQLIAELLTRKSGCTTADVLAATGWTAVSMPAMAKACGLTLRKEKEAGSVTKYFGER
jgi:hypothetical protein